MPGDRRTAAAGEQPKPVVQPRRDLLDVHRAGARGGQLDGQRQTVQAAADLDDGGHRVPVQPQPWAHGARPVGEQAHRRSGQDGGRIVAVMTQRRDGEQHLSGDGQRFAAGGEDAQPRTARQESVGQIGRGVDQMLAVVQDQDRRPVGQRIGQSFERVAPHCGAGFDVHGVAHTERADDGLGQVHRVGDGGELDQPDPVWRVRQQRGADLTGEPGLSRAARTDERDQSALADQLAKLREFGVASQEAGQLRAQVCAGAGGRGLCAEQLGVPLLQRGRRIRAEFVGQRAAQPCVHTQGVGGSAVHVQRVEQERDRPFPGRMGGHQLFQLDDHVGGASGAQVRVDAVLLCGKSLLLQRDGFGLADDAGQVRERGAPPQALRLGQQLRCTTRVAGLQQPTPVAGQRPEAVHVDILRCQRESITGRLGNHGLRPAQCAPQSRDKRL